MSVSITSDAARNFLANGELSESQLMLDHLNWWVHGVQYRYQLIVEARRKGSTMAADPDTYWDRLAQDENTPESRSRVLQIFQLASQGKAEELNKLLGNYTYTPWVSLDTNEHLALRFSPVDPSFEIRAETPESPRACKYPSEEVMAVLAVLHLAQAGLLGRLGQCAICNQMFVITKREQKTCSSKCSKKAYAQTPRERERRAAAARKKYSELFGAESGRSAAKREARRKSLTESTQKPSTESKQR